MSHKLTIRAVVDAATALSKLCEKELKRQPLSLKLARVRRVFMTEARDIDDRRRDIEKEYMVVQDGVVATDDEGGIRLSDPPVSRTNSSR